MNTNPHAEAEQFIEANARDLACTLLLLQRGCAATKAVDSKYFQLLEIVGKVVPKPYHRGVAESMIHDEALRTLATKED